MLVGEVEGKASPLDRLDGARSVGGGICWHLVSDERDALTEGVGILGGLWKLEMK